MASTVNVDESVFDVRDIRPTPDAVHEYDRFIYNANVPIIIDNGSYQCRAGWCVDDEPRLIFKNVVAKQRGKKDCEIQVGNDIGNIELVRWLLKSQFDRDVVTQYDVQEQVLDYIFTHLGIDSEGCVEHPIIMTETLCNPKYSRQLMSELLFEGYHVPGVAYGVDSLFSYHGRRTNSSHSTCNDDDGLVVSFGHQATHVIPVSDGWPQMNHARRINVGGWQMTNFMHRLLQLKYPGHFSAITLSRAETFIHDHAYLVSDYAESVAEWADLDYYDANVHKIQLPFNPLPSVASSSEALKEKRQLQIKRLQEINAKRREEKLAADEEQLRQLNSVQEILKDGDEDAFNLALDDLGLSSVRELYDAIQKVKLAIQRTRDKMNNEGRENILSGPGEEPKPKRFCDELAAKSQGDLDSWITFIRQKRQELLDSKAQRRKKKSDMAKRRTFAAQERMKIISELAADRKKDDNFGQNEDDWQVYKAINREAGESDSEEENEKLGELEQILRENDPSFVKESLTPEFPFDLAEYYRLHLGVERIRVPELVFQPSMVGIEQASISETISYVLGKFDTDIQDRLVKNMFITGGVARIPGFRERLEAHLLATRAFQSSFKVSIDEYPSVGAWRGAKLWALDDSNLNGYLISKADYEETGAGDRFKEHRASNRCIF